jgi:hypothetical protein
MILINKQQHPITVATLLLAVFITSGCSVRLADLTLVSTKNIDLSNAKFDVSKGQRTKGEDCAISLLGLIPLGIPNLEKAVDNALEKGNGNVMVDQVTYHSGAYFIIVSRSCIDVEGTVLNTGTTGGITNKPVVKQPTSYNTNTPVTNQSVQTPPAPSYQPVVQPQTQVVQQPVQPVLQDTAPTYQTYQQPQVEHSGKDLTSCLALVDNAAIARCVKGK